MSIKAPSGMAHSTFRSVSISEESRRAADKDEKKRAATLAATQLKGRQKIGYDKRRSGASSIMSPGVESANLSEDEENQSDKNIEPIKVDDTL